MKTFLKGLALVAVAAACFTMSAPKANAQVSINVGVAPVCPYGYYDYAPYDCAPWGYYGPEWFNGGVFIGAGPWWHGHEGFRGSVDNHYDIHGGYHGPYPHAGSHVEAGRVPGHVENFHANEWHDGRGHYGRR